MGLEAAAITIGPLIHRDHGPPKRRKPSVHRQDRGEDWPCPFQVDGPGPRATRPLPGTVLHGLPRSYLSVGRCRCHGIGSATPNSQPAWIERLPAAMPRSVHHHAAVDVERVPGDVGVLGAHEEIEAFGDVLRLAGPPQGNQRLPRLTRFRGGSCQDRGVSVGPGATVLTRTP